LKIAGEINPKTAEEIHILEAPAFLQ